MNRFAFVFSAMAAIIVASCITVTGADLLPGDNPMAFRDRLHRDFIAKDSSPTPAIPTVLPGVSDAFPLAASTFEDVLVSESVGPANFTQEAADIAALKGGRWVAVWEDNRLGPVGVYLQLFDNTGNPIGGNTALIVGTDFNLSDPAVCADGGGNFYVAWREDINGYLQAARFDSLANLITPVFFVSDTVFSSYAGEFDAACLTDGRLLVAWEDYTFGNDIAFQAFTTAGNSSTPVTVANSDGLDVRHWSPVAAAAAGGDFAIAWEDYRTGTADIYFRRFNALGIAYGPEITPADAAAPDSSRFLPSAVYSSVDGYVVAWVDLRDGQNIYAQRISLSGTPVGANLLVSSAWAEFPNWDIDLGVNSLGHLLACWTLYGNENSIILQRFVAGLQPDGIPQAVSGPAENQRFNPAVAGNQTGISGIVWTDLALGSIDIFAAACANDGAVIRSAFRINDDTLGSPSWEPRAVAYDRYEWTVVFTDMRRDAGDIYLQDIYVGGDLIRTNRRINGDGPGAYQSQPAVAVANSVLCICWTDVRNAGVNGQNIFCRFSKPHYDLTAEIVVNNDSLGQAAHYDPDCAATTGGISLVVWTDRRGGNAKIYGQLFSADYQKLGSNFLIGPSEPSEIGESSAVSIDSNGTFIVGYLNRLNPNGPSVEVKRITTAGQITGLFEFASNVSGYQIDGFDVAVNGDDEVYVVWHGYEAGATDLFLTGFDYAGNIIAATTSITDDLNASPGVPDIAVDNVGHLLVTWLDRRSGTPMPFRQIFDPALNPLQPNTPVTTGPGVFMQPPATAGFRGRGIFVWADGRQNGLNIYASQELYDPTDVPEAGRTLPAQMELQQNYPNPFNPSTVIRFSLSRAGHVKLQVLNLLGQTVRTLVNDSYPAGSHDVLWDGTDTAGRRVASGVYLYRLESDGFDRTRKMTLIK